MTTPLLSVVLPVYNVAPYLRQCLDSLVAQSRPPDEIIAVDDGDAICMAQSLARQLGLAVGISSGANFLGALLAQDMLGQAATVVTIFCDDNKKYLSTALMQEEPRKAEFLSPAVELLGFSCLPRAFARGWDPFPH